MKDLARILAAAVVTFALLASPVQAQTGDSGPPDTVSEYADDFSSSDLSMQLMTSIFGPLWSSMLGDGGINMDAEGDGRLLGHISLILNAAALALISLFVVFTVITGILQTGHEGVVLGQKYSTLLVPARVIIALIALVPVAGGYSLAQAGVMLVGKAGAGVANAVYHEAIDYVALDGGLVSPPVTDGVGEFVSSLLQAQVCKITTNMTTPGMVTKKAEAYTSGENIIRTLRFTSQSNWGTNICGKFVVNEDSYYEAIVNNASDTVPADSIQISVVADSPEAFSAKQFRVEQWQAVLDLRTALLPIARDIAHSAGPSGSDYRTAARNYYDALHKASDSFIERKRQLAAVEIGAGGEVTSRGTILEAGVEQMKELGWAGAGAFYWTLVKLGNRVHAVLEQVPTASGPGMTRITSLAGDKYTDTLLALTRARQFTRSESVSSLYTGNTDNAAAVRLAQTAGTSEAIKGQMGTLIDKAINQDVASSIAKYFMGGGTPVLSLQQAGQTLMGTAETLYVVYLTGYAVAKGYSGSTWASLTSLFTGGAVGMLAAFLKALAPVLFTLFLAMMMLGLVLAYWLPAIPLVLWIFGMVGWMIMMVEAVFAAIIWAAAHAIPEGDGWAGSHAKSGYMLLLGLFMRPALMVTGLFAGMLIMPAAGHLIAVLFPLMLVDASIDSLIGLVGFLASIAILTMLFVTVADRAFGLSHVLPDKVLRWVSGPMENLGESEDNNRTRMMMAGVAGRLESAAQGIGRSMGDRDPSDDGGNGQEGDEQDYHT